MSRLPIGAIATIVGLIGAQIIAGLIWGAKVENRVTAIERNQTEQNTRIDHIDDRGSRQIPLFETRVAYVEQLASKTANNLVALEVRIDRQDTPLSKNVNSMQIILTDIVQRQVAINASNVGRFEQMNKDIKRIEDRADKIVQALDALYAKVTEQH